MMARFLIALIRIYQRTLSPLLGNVCRFEPSCSRYAVLCLAEFGALRGGLLSMRRLCKCHPFHPGGYDPPPARTPESHEGLTRAEGFPSAEPPVDETPSERPDPALAHSIQD
jgi:putative membrane protein insertion efficiency factor